jgi:hypothetical protein
MQALAQVAAEEAGTAGNDDAVEHARVSSTVRAAMALPSARGKRLSRSGPGRPLDGACGNSFATVVQGPPEFHHDPFSHRDDQ